MIQLYNSLSLTCRTIKGKHESNRQVNGNEKKMYENLQQQLHATRNKYYLRQQQKWCRFEVVGWLVGWF